MIYKCDSIEQKCLDRKCLFIKERYAKRNDGRCPVIGAEVKDVPIQPDLPTDIEPRSFDGFRCNQSKSCTDENCYRYETHAIRLNNKLCLVVDRTVADIPANYEPGEAVNGGQDSA